MTDALVSRALAPPSPASTRRCYTRGPAVYPVGLSRGEWRVTHASNIRSAALSACRTARTSWAVRISARTMMCGTRRSDDERALDVHDREVQFRSHRPLFVSGRDYSARP